MNASQLVISLLIAWAAVTGLLVVLIIYRSIVSMKREGQLFLDAGEAHLEAEQKEILRKLDQVAPYIKGLMALSGILIVILGTIWVYQGLTAGPSAG